MRKTILTFSIVLLQAFIAIPEAWASEKSLSEAYDELDEAIEQSEEYLHKKEQQIEGLKRRIERAQNDQDRMKMMTDLYEAYNSYSVKNAIDCLNEGKKTAQKLMWNDTQRSMNISLAYQYASGGAYAEALSYIEAIDAVTLSEKTLTEYWFVRSFIYMKMASETNNKDLALNYKQKADQYSTTYYQRADKSSINYYQLRLLQLVSEKKADDAYSLCMQWKESIKQDSREYALMAYYVAECWRLKKSTEKQCLWLATAATADIKNSVGESMALYLLADILYKKGDTERSNKYAEQVWQSATAFESSTLIQKVSPMITAINNGYREAVSEKSGKIIVMTIIISAMGLVLLIGLIMLANSWRRLSMVYKNQRNVNSELAALNTKLQETSQEAHLAKRQLDDSNRVKDEFITQLLSICSGYIGKMDKYRLEVKGYLKDKKLKELERMAASSNMIDNETKELFARFDEVFLKLCPTFVDDFNALLLPEHHQTLGPGHSLSTDMRMAALIRLGIDDSASIAEFMHLSPNTVYNYRARLKSKAAGDRNEFENRIKMIGL